jgi:hypothetical protein
MCALGIRKIRGTRDCRHVFFYSLFTKKENNLLFKLLVANDTVEAFKADEDFEIDDIYGLAVEEYVEEYNGPKKIKRQLVDKLHVLSYSILRQCCDVAISSAMYKPFLDDFLYTKIFQVRDGGVVEFTEDDIYEWIEE